MWYVNTAGHVMIAHKTLREFFLLLLNNLLDEPFRQGSPPDDSGITPPDSSKQIGFPITITPLDNNTGVAGVVG